MIKKIEKEKLISTTQLAKQLHTSNKVILEVAKKSGINKKIENGKSAFWNEEESSIIIKNIGNSNASKQPLLQSKGQIKTPLMIKEEAQNSLNNLKNLDINEQIEASFLLQANVLKILKENNDFLSRDNKELKIKLDQDSEYYSIKRVSILNNKSQKDYNWRILKSKSFQLGKEIKAVPDSNYGIVKSYHIDVWRECYPKENY